MFDCQGSPAFLSANCKHDQHAHYCLQFVQSLRLLHTLKSPSILWGVKRLEDYPWNRLLYWTDWTMLAFCCVKSFEMLQMSFVAHYLPLPLAILSAPIGERERKRKREMGVFRVRLGVFPLSVLLGLLIRCGDVITDWLAAQATGLSTVWPPACLTQWIWVRIRIRKSTNLVHVLRSSLEKCHS